MDTVGWTPLEIAASKGSAECVSLLLAADADVTLRSINKWTALHAAAYGGDPDCVKAILAHHPDLNSRDDCGHTPLKLAADHPDIVAILKAAGATE